MVIFIYSLSYLFVFIALVLLSFGIRQRNFYSLKDILLDYIISTLGIEFQSIPFLLPIVHPTFLVFFFWTHS